MQMSLCWLRDETQELPAVTESKSTSYRPHEQGYLDNCISVALQRFLLFPDCSVTQHKSHEDPSKVLDPHL